MSLHLLLDIRRGFDLIGIAHLNEHETAQILDNLTCQRARIGAGIESLMNCLQPVRGIVIHDGRNDIQHCLTRGSAEHGLCERERDLVAHRRKLIKQGNRIPHPARGLTRDLDQAHRRPPGSFRL